MTKRYKQARPKFDSRGGVIVLSRSMLQSQAYRSLDSHEKVLMMELQQHWRDDKPVSFGVREAASVVGCRLKRASLCFDNLREKGFLVLANESFFGSKTGSRSREWKLTWLPFDGNPPTHDWEKWKP